MARGGQPRIAIMEPSSLTAYLPPQAYCSIAANQTLWSYSIVFLFAVIKVLASTQQLFVRCHHLAFRPDFPSPLRSMRLTLSTGNVFPGTFQLILRSNLVRWPGRLPHNPAR